MPMPAAIDRLQAHPALTQPRQDPDMPPQHDFPWISWVFVPSCGILRFEDSGHDDAEAQ